MWLPLPHNRVNITFILTHLTHLILFSQTRIYSQMLNKHSVLYLWAKAGQVHCIVICITCNQPHIFVDSILKSQTLQFTCWAPFAVKWVVVAFSSDCSKFLYHWLWFWQTQTKKSEKWKKSENILSLIYTNVMILYFLYPLEKWFAKYLELVLSTIYCTQFHCLDLNLWLAYFKICLKILSGWPRFV